MGHAAAWSTIATVAMRLGTFLVGIVAARIIAPEEFGVFAVALTVYTIIINVSDLGVSAFVIRHDGDLRAVGPTVTTIALLSAALLTVAMILAAPWISTQFGAPAATGPVRILSLTVLFAGVSSVPGALLTREFRQDKRFVASLANFLTSTAILVPLALAGGGALALAWSRVGGMIVTALVLIKAAPARYLPGFDREVTSSVVSFGLPLVGSSFLGFLIGNIDFIVIARLLGAEQLGFYYLAHNVGSWPYVIMSPIVASVTVAAFSRVRRDRKQFADRMSTSMAAMASVGFPANALIIALAPDLVEALYGPRWLPAAAALAFTAAYGAMRVPADLFSNIAISEGRTRAMLVCQIAYLLALAPLTVVGVRAWGIVGAGVAHVVAIALVLLPGFMWMLAGSTGFGYRRLLAAVGPPLAAATAAGLVAHLLAQQLSGAWISLIVGGLGGVGLYALLMASWGRRVVVAGRRLWSLRGETGTADDSVELVGPARGGASA